MCFAFSTCVNEVWSWCVSNWVSHFHLVCWISLWKQQLLVLSFFFLFSIFQFCSLIQFRSSRNLLLMRQFSVQNIPINTLQLQCIFIQIFMILIFCLFHTHLSSLRLYSLLLFHFITLLLSHSMWKSLTNLLSDNIVTRQQ